MMRSSTVFLATIATLFSTGQAAECKALEFIYGEFAVIKPWKSKSNFGFQLVPQLNQLDLEPPEGHLSNI
jgi:hypothetical protein